MKNFYLLILIVSSQLMATSQQPTTLFCHGIVDDKSQMDRYEEFIEEQKKSFDFADATEPSGWNLNNLVYNICASFGKKVNRDAMAMGHGIDIQTLHDNIRQEKNYILYGVSRGGATIISYLAQHNPTNVQAIVIDAAPADVVSAVNDIQSSIGLTFAPERTQQEWLFNFIFPAYPINSTPAVKDIANINNKNLPIFIVHSYEDSRVAIESAWQLYISFKDHGFKHVHLCQLDHGPHAHYMHGPDKDRYLQALHSFYKKYNFNHNPEYAQLEVQTIQPSVDEIVDALEKNNESKKNRYHTRNKMIQQVLLSGLVGSMLCASAYLYNKQL